MIIFLMDVPDEVDAWIKYIPFGSPESGLIMKLVYGAVNRHWCNMRPWRSVIVTTAGWFSVMVTMP